MEDSRIIQLFFQRDEEAIEEVSRKYSAYCSKIVWNVLYNKEDCDECLNGLHSGHVFHRTDQNVCLHLQEK